ncbi:hypothetical protein HK405_009163, partial [Cladochytrium tenue]
VECLGPVDPAAAEAGELGRPLTLAVTFVRGAGPGGDEGRVAVELPIPLSKFVGPVRLAEADFFQRWRQVGGPPREAQAVFAPRGGTLLDRLELIRRVGGIGLNIMDSIDQAAGGVVGVGILSCADLGKVGCMIRVEVNKEHKMYRCTVRSTNEVVSHMIRNLAEEIILAAL